MAVHRKKTGVWAAIAFILLMGKESGYPFSITVAPDIEIGAGMESRHSWRGFLLTGGPSAGFVSSLDMDSFLIGFSGFHETARDDDSMARGGLDAVFKCKQKLGRHSLSGGYYLHAYRTDGDKAEMDTQEVFLGYNFSPAFRPTIRCFADLYYDFDRLGGWYADAGIRDSFEVIPARMDMDIALSLGWADDKYSAYYRGSAPDDGVVFRKHAMTDFSVRVEFPVMFGENRELAPSVAYSSIVDSRIRGAVEKAGPDAAGVIYAVFFRMFL